LVWDSLPEEGEFQKLPTGAKIDVMIAITFAKMFAGLFRLSMSVRVASTLPNEQRTIASIDVGNPASCEFLSLSFELKVAAGCLND
jgi:hypothetical protein